MSAVLRSRQIRITLLLCFCLPRSNLSILTEILKFLLQKFPVYNNRLIGHDGDRIQFAVTPGVVCLFGRAAYTGTVYRGPTGVQCCSCEL
jgi:hypothetical protein